jgi:crotonobetainyl-CoA:carnitine CoA-transferase CaiB-like acyl-CoA transferase
MAIAGGGPPPLGGVRVLTLAVNIPGPLAALRLRRLGAQVTKIEPPAGDPLALGCAAWYRELITGQEVLHLDLKASEGRTSLEPLLAQSDLLLTATRPAALDRLGFGWPVLHARYPRLCQVAILSYLRPAENQAGHDLTYQAAAGLVNPPQLPLTLAADLAAAERVAGMAVALLLGRERGGGGRYAEVAIAEVAAELAAPLRYGLTSPGGILAGGLARYGLYRTADGWIALAALEPHFWQRLMLALGLQGGDREELERAFHRRTAPEWEEWARARDLPIVAVREPSPPPTPM